MFLAGTAQSTFRLVQRMLQAAHRCDRQGSGMRKPAAHPIRPARATFLAAPASGPEVTAWLLRWGARQAGESSPSWTLTAFDLTVGEVVLQLPAKGAHYSLPETVLSEMKNYEYSI